MGAGTLGVTGKFSSAAITAHSTNKAVEQFAKNSISSYSKDIDSLLDTHSSVNPKKEKEVKEDEKRDRKKAVINKVLNNSQDYDLEGDTIPQHLNKLIKEIKDAVKDSGINIDETTIKNTIKNSKNPGKAINDLFSSSVYPEEGSNEVFDKAKQNLVDYGVEYAVNKKFNDASEVGINSGAIMSSITKHKEVYTPDLIGGDQFVQEALVDLDLDKLDIKSNSTQVMEKVFGEKNEHPSTREIEDFKTEVDQYQKSINDNIMNIQSKFDSQDKMDQLSKDMIAKLKEKSEQIEKNKTVAIAQAICHIEKENLSQIEELVKETTKDLEKLLQNKTITNSVDLEELKKALEALKM